MMELVDEVSRFPILYLFSVQDIQLISNEVSAWNSPLGFEKLQLRCE